MDNYFAKIDEIIPEIKYPDIKSKLLLKKLYENFETEEIIKFQIDNFNKFGLTVILILIFMLNLKKL